MKKYAAACALLMAASLHAADDVLLKAMRDEMDRSMAQLRLENLDKPYFIAYRAQETSTMSASASFGSLLSSTENRTRAFTVEIRVGDYALDNTNFLSPGPGAFGVGSARLPLEDNYKEIRRQIWLATDGAYKKAVEDLGKKRSALQNRNRTDALPDFSKEQAATVTEPAAPLAVNRAEAEKMVRELSALFRNSPQVSTSTVSWNAVSNRRLYINSEGTSFTRTVPQVTFTVLAGAFAADGMPLQDFLAAYGRSMEELPKKDELAAGIREMGERLARLREAPLLDRYNGPVLFEGQAAAEIFSQAFAPRLLAVRRPISDNAQMERAASQSENPFLDKLGSRVLPDFLSVEDNATRKEFQGARLMGWFPVDDEGVTSRETKLIEQGFLKTLLSTRNPVRGIKGSSGSRRGAGPAPSNLIVTAEKGLSDQELKDQFLKVIGQRNKEFGIVIRRMGNPAMRALRDASFAAPGGEGSPVEGAILAYKVFPDGHEELIRNAAVTGINPAAFKDILAASATQNVYTAPFSGRTGVGQVVFDGGTSIVSFAVPSLLFEDVTVTKPRGDIAKPPVAKHPFFDK